MSDDNSAIHRAERLDEWAVHRQAVRQDYVRRLPLYRRGFAVLMLAGFACFAFGGLAGLWGSISATFVSVTGYLMVKNRVHELTKEIGLVQDDAERLREG